MTRPSLLLAKSQRDPERAHGSETLRGHTLLVVRAGRELVSLRGSASLRAAGLSSLTVERLDAIVAAAALAHDLGKANDQFQAMVRGQRRQAQLVRHEALSLWLTWPGQPLASWLRPAVSSDTDYLLAILAAAGHHRRFGASAMAGRDAGAGSEITLYTGHPDFAALLRAGADALAITAPGLLSDLPLRVARRASPAHDFARWEQEASELLRRDHQARRLLALAKALVLDADVAGSALPRAGESLDWIRCQLERRADRERLESIVSRRLSGAAPRPFQEAVAASTAPVTLVRAGCGSGKTAAAYLWAARQHAGRQLWITYPTTGTTTEGFRDYLVDVDIDGRLEHSRADVDLDMLGLRDDEGRRARDRDRLDAIRAWGCEVVTSTVDTVLGLMQSQRKGMYAWAGLADSAVVFDEIHAYDDRLFGILLRFLEDLSGVPTLLMTASLPEDRLGRLQAVVHAAHARDLEVIGGPAELENLPRYRRHYTDDPWATVRACLDRGGKVLWVHDTVDRCMSTAASSGDRALIYHSRFRYLDRVERHRAVIDAFRSTGPAFAVTTQVAEMSLDLSADLLVTDLAPVPALIQRLGRLNRRATPESPRESCPFVVVPFRGKPYEDIDYDAALAWLERLGDRTLSQRDLVEAWTPAPYPEVAREAASWIDGGYHTAAAAVREEGIGLTILRSEDATAAARNPRDAVALALPMGPPPRSLAWRTWPTVRGYPVAPSEAVDYDPVRGGAWR
jgi:CRISPR-associated endonuclease/helicase Cas3